MRAANLLRHKQIKEFIYPNRRTGRRKRKKRSYPKRTEISFLRQKDKKKPFFQNRTNFVKTKGQTDTKERNQLIKLKGNKQKQKKKKKREAKEKKRGKRKNRHGRNKV